IAPFQNRRYEAHYRKVREIIDSGALGEVLQVRISWHRFTRRWDWQAMSEFGGGALFNNGTHLLDVALPMLGEADPEIFLDLRRGLSLGDADEHMKLMLRAPGAPTIDIELTNAGAYDVDRWHILGTAGGLRGTTERLEWRTIDWSSMPAREVDLGPAAGRRYPEEEINWAEHAWEADSTSTHPYTLFYLDLHDAIRRGRPMLVTPASALRYVEILDRCRAQLASSLLP
ncbi:MAG: Gfo/Idh/MocA family oxidoreductase, partial [Planctomycetota bacterium]